MGVLVTFINTLHTNKTVNEPKITLVAEFQSVSENNLEKTDKI
jgi:hypothetical protein